MAGALSGLRVVEVAGGWAAPLCGNVLSGLGATVVRVEPPGGDPLRQAGPTAGERAVAYDLVNAGKEALSLDLSGDAGRRRLHAALDGADVFLHDRSPAELAQWKCPAVVDPAMRRGMVECVVTPYGTFGPLRDWAGSELTVQAASGLLATTGYPGGPPMRVGGLVAQGSAALAAASAILAAQYRALRTGRGQRVEVAWYDATVALLGQFAALHFVDGAAIAREGNRHPVNAPWNVYPASDGSIVICTGHRPSQWRRLCQVMGREQLIEDPRFATTAQRRANVEHVDAVIAGWTSPRTRRDLIEVLEANRIPVGQVTNVAEMLRSDQTVARHLLQLAGDQDRRVGVTGPITGLSGADLQAAERHRGVADRLAIEPDDPVLRGLRVVELSLGTSGPYVGRTLAALGADVIKVEPAGGEPLRHHAVRIGDQSYLFGYLNNLGKRSVELDTATVEGRDALRALVATADVFVENFVPGALADQGLDWETLGPAHPGLVYTSVSGFGDASPWRAKRAYDTVVQAMTGLMSVTGDADREPLSSGVSLADVTAASLAVVSVLAALVERHRTGAGQLADVSMFDAAAWLGQEGWAEVLANGRSPGRVGNRHWWYWPHDVFAAADGPVAIACETVQQREALRSVVGVGAVPGGASARSTKPENQEDLEVRVRQWVSARPAATVVADCQAAGVPAAPVLEVADALDHPHATARHMVVDVVDHSGEQPAPALGIPFHLADTPATLGRAIGPAGCDTEAVLGPLGLDDPQSVRADDGV